MENREEWWNFKYRKGGRFRPGDIVTMSLGKARRLSLFKEELSAMRQYVVDRRTLGPGPIEPDDVARLFLSEVPPKSFTVVMTRFDDAIAQWIVWVADSKRDVYRIEQEFLALSWSNFRTTKMAIETGRTAREVLGLQGAPKRYRSILFKGKAKND